MTNGSGPHPKPVGKPKAGGDKKVGKRKPAAEVLTKGLKRKPEVGVKGSGG